MKIGKINPSVTAVYSKFLTLTPIAYLLNQIKLIGYLYSIFNFLKFLFNNFNLFLGLSFMIYVFENYDLQFGSILAVLPFIDFNTYYQVIYNLLKRAIYRITLEFKTPKIDKLVEPIIEEPITTEPVSTEPKPILNSNTPAEAPDNSNSNKIYYYLIAGLIIVGVVYLNYDIIQDWLSSPKDPKGPKSGGEGLINLNSPIPDDGSSSSTITPNEGAYNTFFLEPPIAPDHIIHTPEVELVSSPALTPDNSLPASPELPHSELSAVFPSPSLPMQGIEEVLSGDTTPTVSSFASSSAIEVSSSPSSAIEASSSSTFAIEASSSSSSVGPTIVEASSPTPSITIISPDVTPDVTPRVSSRDLPPISTEGSSFNKPSIFSPSFEGSPSTPLTTSPSWDIKGKGK